ncbi:MAG: sulfotransferase [Gammaproteobacteria bacterium]
MPFFILANPRSGSTMFRLILNAHSRVVVPPESGFTLWYADKYTGFDGFSEAILDEFISDILRAKKFETLGLSKKLLREVIFTGNPESYVGLVDLVYKAYAKKMGKDVDVVGDKNNYYINHIAELLQYFPKEKFILLIRDGRDVALSYKNLNRVALGSRYRPQLTAEIEEIAFEWRTNGLEFLNLMNTPNVMLVRYEDLLSNTESRIQAVLRFLEVSYEGSVLDFYLKNDEPKDFLKWKGKTTEAIDPSNTGKYKKFLSASEIEIFNEISGDVLDAFGYDK